jgi:hypothetical protein
MVKTHVRFKCDGIPARSNKDPVACSQSTEIDGTANVSYDGRLVPQLPVGWGIVGSQHLCDVCNDKFQSDRFRL